jgi:hypothetical protein
MSATPTIRPSQSPVKVGSPVPLHGAVEQLFSASDATGVMETCELILANFGIPGRLHWRRHDGPVTTSSERCFDLAEDPQASRTLSLELSQQKLPGSLQQQLQWMGRLADIRLHQLAESSRLYKAISRLALAERLQRALYEIAEQASADHDMPQLMRSLHAIVSSLMYAENFYIVLYDEATSTIRFPYYVDIVDTDQPVPDQSMPLRDMPPAAGLD